MLMVSGLYIYPVKSLAGIAVESAQITSRGLLHDRRLVLVDAADGCLTQRDLPAMALLQPVLNVDGLYIHHKTNNIPPLFVPAQPVNTEPIMVKVWDDNCQGQVYSKQVNDWFSQALGTSCRLVYMPDTSQRAIDKRYALNNEITSFADGYPTLMIGQASLDDLNTRLAAPLPMNRFRPNIVFTGGTAFVEDRLQQFSINDISFTGVKPCARCVMTTINQDDTSTSKEPLKTLATYRLKNNKILFGQNLLHKGDGTISIGDTIDIKAWQPAAI